uniref:Laminin, alpha 1 n=1 Tax=Denticeps clupeoides TaxID=299321 RepID=A0AAY4A3J5_9TELE
SMGKGTRAEILGPGGTGVGLFPAILNLASNAEITTNATCGDPEPEMYCKLVEHVPGRRIHNPQCRICDGSSANPKEQHPITYAIDGTNRWWQSPSIKNGRQFHWVTITLDLRQIFQVAYIIIKAANSPRPGNWILERSLDGKKFEPWQYYAISDTECLTRYNITPRLGPPTYKRDDEVICTSYYSRLVPLEHGEIHTSLINGRPSADDLTPELLEFTSARYIRLRLQRIRTLNADLMTLSYRDPKDVDPIVTRRYYYSIKDISVGGMCICYGHAQSCPLDPETRMLQCKCEHNTCGESCNECCPGYHQQPWQPGTISAGNTCEKCNCHSKAGDCYYNRTVAEQRRSMNVHGQYVGGGVCINCTQNTAGVNCETCADGFFRPHKVSPYSESPCVDCNCDMRGSLSPACIRDDNHAQPERGLNPGQCLCKEGFAGERCDRCAFGYRDFPLCTFCECSLEGSLNIDPCTECICKANVMGANCDLCKRGFYNLQASNPEGCTECFCFGVSDVCESSTCSLSNLKDNLIIPGNVSSYHILSTWAATDTFLGNKVTSYGGFLKYSVAYDVSMENVDKFLLSHFDFIIEGNGRSLRQSPSHHLVLTPLNEQSVSVAMVPHSFVDLHTGRHIQKDELMMVLADVAGLRIRSYLNTSAEGALRLSTVSLDVANPDSTTHLQAKAVEQCECPWGYSGTSCEYCISGFYRVGGILFGGNCLQCECNDHATECDINGMCLGCKHNTTGPHCDQCLPGFYGDPSEGTAEDCQRCACPLTVASNNFSPTCSLESSGEMTCDQCQQGYTGQKCERCGQGYHGNPSIPGEGCVLCECNGNVDTLEPGHCDPNSGECLKCMGYTSGPHCERCQDGYYGDAITAKNCQACGCHGNGSSSSICDIATGQCVCKPHVVGEKCDRCEVCLVGFHSLSRDHCIACNCSQSGSTSTACDEEGRCQCVAGVTGDKCDHCDKGYYNFQKNGCTACDCEHTHGNCDPDTGVCICPPHTKGEKCELCEEDHWGHDGATGCKPCNCSVAGVTSTQCDLASGQCSCAPAFDGQKCDHCALGFRNFPECTACDCNPNGTREEFCDEQLGLCGCEDQGSCVCKDNVGGRGCDECKRGTFGLSVHNPAGCSACFCFGVSSECEELGGLIRVPITLGPEPERLHVVSQSNLQGTLDGVFAQGSEMLLDPSLVQSSSLAGPHYWRLPKHFQGNKLLSYGGKLSYVVNFFALDGEGLVNFEPQVLIRGGHLKKSVIFIDMPAPKNGFVTHQEVPLTEHQWKYFNSVSEKAVSHSDFMSVLSNVEYVLIKASYGTDLQQSRITNITMETAIEADEVSGDRGAAQLVESCECPPGYAGLSCQECAPGYFRQPLSELNMKGKNRPLIQPCVPCQCNNHSLACDLDNGKCLGCQHNTAGEYCNVCVQGYYGKVKGSINDCSLCACPLQSNSFSTSCVSDGVGDYRCDACKPGYEGRYCERCAVGYYGNPSEPGGRCEPCQCSGTGSLHQVCDSLTGKCECKVGVTGHTCDECEARHVLIEEQCVSCDDECTGALLDDVWALEGSINAVNLTGVILAPYSVLVSLEKEVQVRSLTFELQQNLSNFGCRGKLSMLEETQDDLERLYPTLRMHVDTLVMELTEKEALQLVYRAEDQARALMEKSMEIQFPNRCVCVCVCVCVISLSLGTGLIHPESLQLFAYITVTESAESKLKEVEMRTEQLFDRMKPLRILGENLSRNLSEIKEMISQARKQAASIKVAVSADRDCVRAYRPEISSSNVNTITLTVKTSEPDNLLFYMGSSSTVDFMALEMHRGKVAFLWDTGSGHTKLEYPDVAINNNKWHWINATRFGKQASLAVHQLDSAPMPAVKATAPGSSTVLDINKTTWMFVGGLSGQVKKSSAVKMTDFKGCMGEASLNEKNIGLWNFAEREGQCRGCFMSPQAEETSFNFDGSGYSVVEKSLRPTATSIIMLFKTLAPNGLLLYLASNGTRDFLSIELVEGKVRVTFELGSGPLTMTSTKAYNTGIWYKIAIQRNKRKGYLAVMAADNPLERETIEAESPGLASDLNRSDLDPIYIGGLPKSRPIRRQVVAHSFVGCIKNMEIARTNFDLLRDSYGVKKGCVVKPIRSASILGGGYLQLPPMTLSPQTELMATFSTKNDSGIILVGFAKSANRMRRQTHQPFLAVMLVSGKLEVHVNMAEGGSVHKAVIKSQKGTFGDGLEHSLVLQRNKRCVSLSDKGSLTLGQFYMGGVPPGEGSSVLSTTNSFYGCISNIVLEANTATLTESHQFGLSRNSHMIVGFRNRTVRTRSVLSLRTFAPSGILYYMANGNQQDYAVLQLQGGQLFFTCDLGKGPAVATLKKPINDGIWHTVKTEFEKRNVMVSVDEEQSVQAHIKGHTLDVEGKLHLGGIPAEYTARRIGNVTHSIAGCVQGVMLNGLKLNTQKPASSYATGACFSSAQEGSFFNGSGHAAFSKEGYVVGSDVTVSLEFRSTAPDGTLLGISSTKVDAIGLELVNGQVVFNVNNGAGRISSTSRSSRPLCDGHWHTMVAKKFKNSLSVTVDGHTVTTPNPYSSSTSAETKNPIYVGGYPAEVKQNCLTARAAFQGCMRNLRVYKGHVTDVLDFSTAFHLSGVFPNSCPGNPA